MPTNTSYAENRQNNNLNAMMNSLYNAMNRTIGSLENIMKK